MNRFEKCFCRDTLGRHDDSGVCRVKDCDCVQFVPAKDPGELVDTVRTTYGGE